MIFPVIVGKFTAGFLALGIAYLIIPKGNSE
jgi:ethanolamine transporter EutH